jgi:hypothetical protein
VSLQEADSRTLTSLVAHSDFYRAPTATMSESTYAMLAEQYGDGFNVQAGMIFVIDDDIYQKSGGKVQTINDPPQTPPALVEVHNIVGAALTKASGNAEVLEGRAQTQVKSGRAIELLQSAAASQIGFKSQRTGDMVYRLARLMLYCLVNRLDVDDLARVVGRYDRHILEVIYERAQRIEWDVDVTIASGAGGVIAQKNAETRSDYQLGLISKETAREKLKIDHKIETDRTNKELTEQAQLQAQLAPPAPAAAGGEQQPPEQQGEAA